MKPSHERTPRSMNECNWTPGYVSADFNQPPFDKSDAIVMAGCLIAAIALVIVFLVWK